MKCPKCKHNQRLRREGMRCKCGRMFVFNPKSDDRISDVRFMAAISKASAGGTQHYTLNQLHGALSKLEGKKTGKQTGCLVAVALLLLVGGGFVLFLADKLGGLVMSVIAAIMGLAALSSHLSGPRPVARLRTLVDKWKLAGNEMEKLVDWPKLGAPPPEWTEPDIYDYGVERVIVVQRDLLVDLFVLNGFHAQERALIVSESGYPHYLMPHLERLLQEHPTLPVFLLHDSTQEGASMKSRILLKPFGALLKVPRPLIDIGLHPKDVQKMKAFQFFKPKSVDYRVPVDLLPYAFLSGGISASLSRNAALGTLLLAPPPPAAGQSSGSGGESGAYGEVSFDEEMEHAEDLIDNASKGDTVESVPGEGDFGGDGGMGDDVGDFG